MSSETHWSDRRALTEYLAHQLATGRLSLFLGSGLSYSFGLPSWEELLRRMANELRVPVPSDFPAVTTPLAFATSLKTKFPTTSDFLRSVEQNLYSTADLSFAKLSSDRTLVALGALTMSSARGGVASVLTLNYDDCLETYLEACGFVVQSVSSPAHWSSRADIAVYHPHGFLPHLPRRGRSSSIVLDQMSFTTAMDKSSPWYQKAVSILRHSTVLMIGIGPGDQNLFGMLANAGEQHPSRAERILYRGVLLNRDLNEHNVEVYKQYGIHTFRVGDYTQDMPNLVYEICQQAAVQRRAELRLDA